MGCGLVCGSGVTVATGWLAHCVSSIPAAAEGRDERILRRFRVVIVLGENAGVEDDYYRQNSRTKRSI